MGRNYAMKGRRRRSFLSLPPPYAWPVLALLILLPVILVVAQLGAFLGGSPGSGGEALSAVVLDGLYDLYPNSTFIESVSKTLRDRGFSVDVFRGTNVTVDLLKKLGEYDLVILRLHSSLSADESSLYIFSGELYSRYRYVLDQLTRTVKRAYIPGTGHPPVFALKATHLGIDSRSGLRNSIVIAMGCQSASDETFARELLERGARAYIGWSGPVSIQFSDTATRMVIDLMYGEGLGPCEAVEKTVGVLGPDPVYGSTLRCFVRETAPRQG